MIFLVKITEKQLKIKHLYFQNIKDLKNKEMSQSAEIFSFFGNLIRLIFYLQIVLKKLINFL